MITIVRLAFLNLLRNPRRATIALLTVVAGVIAIVLADGFAQWIFWAMREGTIQSELGHIKVVRAGYDAGGSADPFAYLIPEGSAVRRDIESIGGVRVVAPRLDVAGLVSHDDATLSFIGEGVDPQKEGELSKAVRIVAGRGLSDMDANEVVLGQGLARALGVAPGDTVTVLANTGKAGINGVELTVAGLFTSVSKAYDDAALRLPLRVAQNLIRARGSHAWLVLLEDTDQTDRYVEQFRRRYPQSSTGLAFIPWHERADFYNKTVALFSTQLRFLRFIIASIIVLAISNILVMNVMERTGEIGTLMALGARRRRILSQFAAEGVILGVVGGLLGVALAAALAQAISAIGIPMPPPPGMDHGYVGEIRITTLILGTAFLLAVVTTAAAGLYPAWRASRLDVVEALRHNV